MRLPISIVLCWIALTASQSQARGQPMLTTAESTEFNQALAFFNQGECLASAIELQRLIKVRRDFGPYWLNLGNAYYCLKNYPEALKAYRIVAALGAQGKTSLRPLAELYQVKTYRMQREFENARVILDQLKKESPPEHIAAAVVEEGTLLEAMQSSQDSTGENAESDMAQALLDDGLSSYKGERYDQALARFNDAMSFAPNAETALMIGMVHLRLGEPQDALLAFNQALALQGPPEASASALEFISQIQKNLWPKRRKWWLWFDLASGYDSNVYQNGLSEIVASAAATQGSTGIGYHLLNSRPWMIDLSYQFTWLEYIGQPLARLQTHTVQTSFAHQTRSWLWQLSPYFQYQNLGNLPLQNRYGTSIVIHKFFSRLGIGAAADLAHSTGAAGNYDYLSGDTISLRPYIEYSTGRLYLSIFGAYLDERIGDMPESGGVLPLGEISRGAGVSISWLANARWRLQLTGTQLNKDYFNHAQPTGTPRTDLQTAVSARLHFYATSTFSIYLNQDGIFNQSTLQKGDVADKNFNQFTTLIGATWNAVQ